MLHPFGSLALQRVIMVSRAMELLPARAQGVSAAWIGGSSSILRPKPANESPHPGSLFLRRDVRWLTGFTTRIGSLALAKAELLHPTRHEAPAIAHSGRPAHRQGYVTPNAPPNRAT